MLALCAHYQEEGSVATGNKANLYVLQTSHTWPGTHSLRSPHIDSSPPDNTQYNTDTSLMPLAMSNTHTHTHCERLFDGPFQLLEALVSKNYDHLLLLLTLRSKVGKPWTLCPVNTGFDHNHVNKVTSYVSISTYIGDEELLPCSVDAFSEWPAEEYHTPLNTLTMNHSKRVCSN